MAVGISEVAADLRLTLNRRSQEVGTARSPWARSEADFADDAMEQAQLELGSRQGEIVFVLSIGERQRIEQLMLLVSVEKVISSTNVKER